MTNMSVYLKITCTLLLLMVFSGCENPQVASQESDSASTTTVSDDPPRKNTVVRLIAKSIPVGSHFQKGECITLTDSGVDSALTYELAVAACNQNSPQSKVAPGAHVITKSSVDNRYIARIDFIDASHVGMKKTHVGIMDVCARQDARDDTSLPHEVVFYLEQHEQISVQDVTARESKCDQYPADPGHGKFGFH